MPLLLRGNKDRDNLGVSVATGSVERQVIIDAQIVAQPDQMRAHVTGRSASAAPPDKAQNNAAASATDADTATYSASAW